MTQSVALYTFGIFIEPSEHPVNDGFHEINDPIFDLVDKAPGLIARSGYDEEPGPPSWGEQVFPRFYEEPGDGWSPSTLSLWTDMESAMAFSYFGLHAKALKRGRAWFRKPQWPPYVVWWTDRERRPDWSEAVRRQEHLHDHGPSPFAFGFGAPFDEHGRPTGIDRQKMKRIAAEAARLTNAGSALR